jgi:hypothetical protein
LFDIWRLLSVDELRENWQTLTHLKEAGEFDGIVTRPNRKVREGWWRRGWIPIATDEMGDFLCIDLDPMERGTGGQLIAFWHDDDERPVVAAGFLAWMRKAARELPREPEEPRMGPVIIELDGQTHCFRDPRAAMVCAMQGKATLAMVALERFAATGHAESHAALSLLHAFHGDRERVLAHSGIALAHHEAFYHLNVPAEHMALVVRGAVHREQWDVVQEAAAAVAGRFPDLAARLHESARHEDDRFNVDPSGDEPAPSEQEAATRYAADIAKDPPSTYSPADH